ncbi:hypothetical protein CC79DRAFT_1364864 [Sarocladium strictum]
MLTENKLTRLYINGVTRSVWTGQKQVKKVSPLSETADLDEPGYRHHVPAELIIGVLLVYKILDFASSEEGDLNDSTTDQANLRTTALFNYNENVKSPTYACERQVTAIPAGEPVPATSEAAQASGLAVGRNAEAAFSVNPNLADEPAEQMQISMAEI